MFILNSKCLFENANLMVEKNKEDVIKLAAYCTDFQLDLRFKFISNIIRNFLYF